MTGVQTCALPICFPVTIIAPVKSKTVEVLTSKKEILSPAVKRIVEEKRIDINTISGSGRDGRILKGDLLESMGLPSSHLKQESPKEMRSELK